jgi:bifunctional lysine-specific demethylase and histidyl-hydroxylase NO66
VVGARDLERFALVKAGLPQAPLEDYVVTSPAIRGKSTGKAPVAHVDARKVARLLERGYTLVIKDAALLSARLQRSCNRLQRDLGAYVGANVYLTPAGAQGLDVHHDTHDTLTLQIEGTKTWRVYEPFVELPLESQQLHRGTRVPPLSLHCEITLAAGETLYLPRGFAHEAVATEGRALHVTFALAPVRVIDLLHETLDATASADVALRRALPRGWQTDPAFAATFAAEMGRQLTGMGADTVASAAQSALGELFAASRSEANAAFDQLIHIAKLRPESLLRTNDDLPFLIRERANAVDVLLPGTSLGLSKSCLPALERLQGGPVRFADLAPELSAADRQVFVKTLAREGLLLVDDPG